MRAVRTHRRMGTPARPGTGNGRARVPILLLVAALPLWGEGQTYAARFSSRDLRVSASRCNRLTSSFRRGLNPHLRNQRTYDRT